MAFRQFTSCLNLASFTPSLFALSTQLPGMLRRGCPVGLDSYQTWNKSALPEQPINRQIRSGHGPLLMPFSRLHRVDAAAIGVSRRSRVSELRLALLLRNPLLRRAAVQPATRHALLGRRVAGGAGHDFEVQTRVGQRFLVRVRSPVRWHRTQLSYAILALTSFEPRQSVHIAAGWLPPTNSAA